MNIERKRRLSIALSMCLIILGWSQWMYPSESTVRWKWFHEITSRLFDQHGHAKFLILFGGFWLILNLVYLFKKYFQGNKK